MRARRARPSRPPRQRSRSAWPTRSGYRPQRGYSISSAPGGTRVELTVERLDDGEVSPYLTDELRRGDQIELRGPIGGYFVWGNGLTVTHTLTRSQPPGWTGYGRRVDAEMLAEVGPAPPELPRVYVRGPTPCVEAVSGTLVQLGHEPRGVKTERFGATGD